MIKKKNSKDLLAEAEKMHKQGIDKLQDDVLGNVDLLHEELLAVASHLRGELPKRELAERLRKLLPTVELLLGRSSKTRSAKRASKVSLVEKTEWLKDRLKGGKSESKGKLVEEFSESRGMKNSPTLLDKAIKNNPAFETVTRGRNVMVTLRKKG